MRLIFFFLLIFFEGTIAEAQNKTIDSFQRAKELSFLKIYNDHRYTFYCSAEIKLDKELILPEGFMSPKYENRKTQLEWEHVVPAENFGRAFIEWREGSPLCVNKKGKPYKGRKCAEKANKTFRLMQADLYNLYPAIGAVNAMRSNKQFSELMGTPNTFGTCTIKIEKNKVEPPNAVKGAIARTYLYMQEAYQEYYHMSATMEKLMHAWDEKYPPDTWECERAHRVQQIQGNENMFVIEKCKKTFSIS